MLEALIVILTPLFFMPLMTAFMAYNHGRSFWRWFGIGCGLPYVSLFVIMFVVHRDKKRLSATPSVVMA
ncbi:hypothetical protein MON38_17675 [Hymenobacter sp. DH14]|uniref:Uncharacterized protein n=1 Tax=Hymenobacter cyanobacteriorum TaxID=2926463 RepID=A0A9X1VJD1_9BACT|nr:hypothetical protein [Hymenobacter cyanobacteriorum]MCI1189258.1 hypothetical protein [Hymenobacter cyanobacteriorum]